MADTVGYWVHASGKWLEVYEHLAEVRRDPGLFGFTRAELQTLLDGAPARERRQAVLTQAMRRGWVRVRFTRERRVAEFWEESRGVLASVGRMLKETHGWPSEGIELHELATGRAWTVESGELMKEVEGWAGGG